MPKSILILGRGDTEYSDRNPKRLYEQACITGFDAQRADYHELESLKEFCSDAVAVIPFFPYKFWNENCEVPKDTGLYGTSRAAYEMLDGFFKEKNQELKELLHNRKLEFVIPLERAAFDRDKIATIQALQAKQVPTAELIATRSLDEILGIVNSGKGLMVKCRYGAEGKGITLLRRDIWLTNYKLEKRRLANYGVYDLWKFTEITGKQHLLKQLLDNEVIIEKEIIPPRVFGDKKFDTRAYVVNYSTVHFFARINAAENIVTNYSQGGILLHNPYTGLSAGFCDSLQETAEAAAQALDLRFVGIDIMFEGNHLDPKVIEAQAFTDFPHKDYFDLAKRMVSEKVGLF